MVPCLCGWNLKEAEFDLICLDLYISGMFLMVVGLERGMKKNIIKLLGFHNGFYLLAKKIMRF